MDVKFPNEPSARVMWIAPMSTPGGLSGWPVPIALSDFGDDIEKEPNNSIKEANRIAIPGAVSGRIQKSDDVDFFLFSAKKGQKLNIEAQALDFYSPTLVYLIVRNAKTGAEVAKSNPQTPVLWAAQAIDITAEIVKLYDQANPGTGTTAAKPAGAPATAPPPAVPPAVKKK